MSDLLLELGSEELPARFVNPSVAALRENLLALLTEARLAHGEAQTFGTPRRLAVLVSEVASRQPDLEREVVGPPVKAAFGPDGEPRPAALGFARTNGLPVAELGRVSTPRGEYLVARVHEQGKPAAELLPGLCAEAVRRLTFPKAMRWGAEDVTYARPLQWICALHGASPVHFQYGDVQSGTQTRGHRFLAPTPFVLEGPLAYVERLREAKVIVAFDERRARVLALCEAAASEAGGRFCPDDELLDQVANLVEWPTAVPGHFDPENLALPREVLVSELRGHQRYFAVLAGAGDALLPAFVAVSATPVRDPALSRHGYERVLRARLADARFFFTEDQKEPLHARIDALKAVVFQQKLGTSFMKIERFSKLAAWLCEQLRVPAGVAAHVERAAWLCKADLTTGMVGEFPELQGVMGREYARASGEPEEVALAIWEHYLPRFSGDRLPTGEVGAIVGLADRLDTLAGLFGIGKPPTGAADPFALRRACLSIVNIVLAKGYRFSLTAALDVALGLLAATLTVPAAEARAQLLDFFRGRLKVAWAEGLTPDLVEAVLAAGFDDLWAARRRLDALAAIRSLPEFLPLASAFKRAGNILEKAELTPLVGETFLGSVDPARLMEAPEFALYEATRAAHEGAARALAASDYAKVLREVTALKPAIDLFFDKVLVMAEDPAVRRNRLWLLAALRELFGSVADLSRIQQEAR